MNGEYVEVDVSILAASLPSLSPLLQKTLSGFSSHKDRADTDSGPQSIIISLEETPRPTRARPASSVLSMRYMEDKDRWSFLKSRTPSEEELDNERYPTFPRPVAAIGVAEIVNGRIVTRKLTV